MLDIEQFKTQLFQLPLEHQEEIADVLCGNIADEYAKQAAEDEARHLEIVRTRKADFERSDVTPVRFVDAVDQTLGEC